MRPVGPSRRGRTLAVAAACVRAPAGEARPGAVPWLERAVQRIDVAVIIAGPPWPGRALAWRAWLRDAGMSERAAARIRFPTHKPPADVYLHPRAVRFDGFFRDPVALLAMLRTAQG